MKFFTLCVLCIFGLSVPGRAQQPGDNAIKGFIVDSVNAVTLEDATICVLNGKDSILREFTRTAKDGSFLIPYARRGKLILLVSYPGYANYAEPFSLDSTTSEKNFGIIYLNIKSRLLNEIIIKGAQSSIKLKGDTTEFDASFFKTAANAEVEDLLKQLPGITVDNKGNITASGQRVKKVLVDGEEFFGDDPTLVTRNLRADMVDKVQLYDKSDRQAEFTGINDGQKDKTINIVLKADKKNGSFGKLEGSGGTDGYYREQAMYNNFSGNRKLAAYGILGNTGQVGLNQRDQSSFSDGESFYSMEDGTMPAKPAGDPDAFEGTYDGSGIPNAQTGGLYYSNKWGQGKKGVVAAYKIGSLSLSGTDNAASQTHLDGAALNSQSTQQFNNSVLRHKADMAYTDMIDSLSTITVSLHGLLKNTDTNLSDSASTANEHMSVLNNSTTKRTNTQLSKSMDASILFMHRFNKKGRSFSWNIGGHAGNDNANGMLNTKVAYYDTSTKVPDSIAYTYQRKHAGQQHTTVNSHIIYVEPVLKDLNVKLNYGFEYADAASAWNAYNLSPGAQFKEPDSLYSGDYSTRQLSNQLGIVFNRQKGSGSLNFGVKATSVNLRQVDHYSMHEFSRHFINWNPLINYFATTASGYVMMGYAGTSQQPGIDQLQPLRNNNDPINIAIGNAALKPSFTNAFNFQYTTRKAASGQAISLSGIFRLVNNAIVNNSTISTTGQATYQFVNVEKNMPYDFNVSLDYQKKVKELANVDVNAILTVSGNKAYSIINGAVNGITSDTYMATLKFSKYETKYSFSVAGSPSYTVGGSSLGTGNDNNYFGVAVNGDFDISLPGNFGLSAIGDYHYYGATPVFGNSFSRLLLNVSVNRTFLKSRNLKMTFSGNDLLNQNSGFNQRVYNGAIVRNTFTTIQRYFLLSLLWNFNKMGNAQKQ